MADSNIRCRIYRDYKRVAGDNNQEEEEEMKSQEWLEATLND